MHRICKPISHGCDILWHLVITTNPIVNPLFQAKLPILLSHSLLSRPSVAVAVWVSVDLFIISLGGAWEAWGTRNGAKHSWEILRNWYLNGKMHGQSLVKCARNWHLNEKLPWGIEMEESIYILVSGGDNYQTKIRHFPAVFDCRRVFSFTFRAYCIHFRCVARPLGTTLW